eukprot:TRINITY_DN905_c0_g2_i1.p1 TRINITY_DN905_c0_g2~~TRINITY_DN905_c0_g2_i1.p1  ORF type:complete len:1026 (+),score=256.07 TRINITY_DN905_c0_g2_i1:76-3153(+)
MAPTHQTRALAALAVSGTAASAMDTAFVGLPAVQTESPVAEQQQLRGAVNAIPAQGQSSSSSSTSLFSTVGAALGVTMLASSKRAQQRKSADVVAVRAFENELGVQAPVGFWDPAGFTANGDAQEFYRRRVVEIKHGRVCMLACTGYIVQHYVRFPGYCSPSDKLSFEEIPNGLGALTKLPAVGIFQWVFFCGLCDLWFMHQAKDNPPGKLTTRLFGDVATNYAYGAFGIPAYLGGKPIEDAEIKKKKLSAELANGRLAMMAIIGMFFQDGLTGSAWGDWSLYTASPLRAFESELGVQAPLGYFDPLGLSKAGDVDEFRRRREAEIKNGRVAMFATIGWIVPEFFRFDGYLSTSQALKFADVPNGLQAMFKVPPEGWLQWVALCGGYEFAVNRPVNPAEPGNYGKGRLGLGNAFVGIGDQSIKDPDARKKGLNSELANGRLAMMAIIGMFVNEGITGKPWGEWQQAAATTAASAFEGELGVQPPVGFWDPVGFTTSGDAAAFRRRRCVELKHGRVAMLACLGYIVPEYSRLPGMLSPSSGLSFEDMPTGLAAVSKLPSSGLAQIIAFAGTVELFQYVDDPTRPPGDFENAGLLGVPNGYLNCPADQKQKKLSAELANGRLAMMAIIGMFYQDGLTGSAWGDWSLYTDSPLRAFESELGVQPPVGFWDPVGFTTSGDAESFRRRRCVELKHGRVAMLACLGYIVPEYARLPGDLSPSSGLTFDSMPTGLAALSKLPSSGLAQIIAFAGTVELFQYVDDPTRPPGDFENAGLLGVPNGYLNCPADQKQKKLSAELANGRLAMMAIIGMFYQDGLTGSAWGDWSLYTDSPLRASVLDGTGGPFPENFWDPAGLSKGKSEQELLNLRAMELKHGRVAMLAVIGWFHVAAGVHYIGDFANGEKVSDDPLINLTQLSMGGAMQVIFTIMCTEWLFEYVTPAPKEKPWDLLGWTDVIADEEYPQWKKVQLQELNNGRLAMMGIVGLIAQDMYLGEYAPSSALCGGNPICYDVSEWQNAFPPSAYESIIYPRG